MGARPCLVFCRFQVRFSFERSASIVPRSRASTARPFGSRRLLCWVEFGALARAPQGRRVACPDRCFFLLGFFVVGFVQGPLNRVGGGLGSVLVLTPVDARFRFDVRSGFLAG